VTEPGAVPRTVYLPAGASWTDFGTGKTFRGAQTIETLAPTGVMPLCVRAGAIIPYGPSIQCAMENNGRLELCIYRGANGLFTLYEDEGDNYNYEKGMYATIPISWSESKQRLTIGKRPGSFTGMLNETHLPHCVGRPGHGAGTTATFKADAEVITQEMNW